MSDMNFFVLIAYASSTGSVDPARSHSLARAYASHTHRWNFVGEDSSQNVGI